MHIRTTVGPVALYRVIPIVRRHESCHWPQLSNGAMTIKKNRTGKRQLHTTREGTISPAFQETSNLNFFVLNKGRIACYQYRRKAASD